MVKKTIKVLVNVEDFKWYHGKDIVTARLNPQLEEILETEKIHFYKLRNGKPYFWYAGTEYALGKLYSQNALMDLCKFLGFEKMIIEKHEYKTYPPETQNYITTKHKTRQETMEIDLQNRKEEWQFEILQKDKHKTCILLFKKTNKLKKK